MTGELKTFAQQCILLYRLQCKQTAKHQDPKEQIRVSACLSPFTTNHICLSLLKIRPQQTAWKSPSSASLAGSRWFLFILFFSNTRFELP